MPRLVVHVPANVSDAKVAGPQPIRDVVIARITTTVQSNRFIFFNLLSGNFSCFLRSMPSDNLGIKKTAAVVIGCRFEGWGQLPRFIYRNMKIIFQTHMINIYKSRIAIQFPSCFGLVPRFAHVAQDAVFALL